MHRTAPITAVLAIALIASTAGAAPSWKAEVDKVLRETKISVNFEDTPLLQTLSFVSQFSDVNIWVDGPLLEEKSEDELLVTLRAEDISVENLLQLITLTKGVVYDLRWGGVLISTKSRLDSLPLRVKTWYLVRSEENLKLLEKLRTKTNFQFEETPVPDVLNFLGTIGSVNIIFLPETAYLVNEKTVTLSAANLSLEHALAAALLPHGLTYEIKDGVVMVRLVPEDPDDAWIEAAERILMRTKVRLEGGLYEDIIAYLDEQVPVPIVYDYSLLAAGKRPLDGVKLDAREVSVKSALGLVTLSEEYAWDYRWESVFISTPERLKLLPKNPLPPAKDPEDWERELRRRLEEDVSFEFDASPVTEAVDFLRQVHDLNIVFEPEAQEAAEALPVTLRLDGVSLKHALAHILYPRNLSYELKHEVIVIRKE